MQPIPSNGSMVLMFKLMLCLTCLLTLILHLTFYFQHCRLRSIFTTVHGLSFPSRFLLWHYGKRQILRLHSFNVLYGNKVGPYSFITLLTFVFFPPRCFHIILTKTPAASSWQYNESPEKQTLILFVAFVWKVKWQYSLIKHVKMSCSQIHCSTSFHVFTCWGLRMDLYWNLSWSFQDDTAAC